MAATRERWYQQPVLWIGLLMLVALVSGWIGMIVYAAKYPDQKLPAGEEVLHVPVAPPSPPPSPPPRTP